MSDKQKTLKEDVTVKGVGLHTGAEVTLTFKPAEADFGYKFKRIDLEGQPIINADIDYVVNTERGTTIENNGVRISTIEHALAALAGLGIDNALIELNASETPILDGSSKLYVDAILNTGIVELDKDRNYFEIDENIFYEEKERKVEMYVMPHNTYKATVMIDYNSSVVGRQHATLHDMSDFSKEFAPCRTFVFVHELIQLLKHNLIKGGDLNNAVVFVDKMPEKDEMIKLKEVFNKPEIEINNQGVLNGELYYQNEPARHKLLDLIGDLALIGRPLKGRLVATRPGHAANVEFAKIIKNHIKKSEKNKAPKYDPNATPLYDINQIKKILPHRPPLLLVDKIIDMGPDFVIGLKSVTMNEGFFVGHFPNEPVMPGVLQIEAMAQAGGVLALSQVPDPENYLTYFLKIDQVKFKAKVVPGDTLIFRLDLVSPIRRGLIEMKGNAYVGNKLVMEGLLMAQIIKK